MWIKRKAFEHIKACYDDLRKTSDWQCDKIGELISKTESLNAQKDHFRDVYEMMRLERDQANKELESLRPPYDHRAALHLPKRG